MAGDELFKRYLEIGASVLGMSRERAESIVRDLVASGELAKSQATKAADWLVERGRTGTEELAEMVRREIRQQVAALGLVTKDDLARVEARIEEVRASAANAATPTASAAAKPRAKPAAATGPAKAAARPAEKTDTAGNGGEAPEAPVKAARAARAPRAPKSARGPAPRPAEPAQPTEAAEPGATTKSAGTSRSASVRPRPGPAGSGAAAPPKD